MEQASWPIAKAQAYGVVLVNDTGEVLLREPKNHFDNYVWTFAKGKPDNNETPAETALRELYEETGYRAEIIGVLPGTYASGLSTNAYFLAKPSNTTPDPFSWETQSIQWASFEKAQNLIGETTNVLGRKRDLAVLKAAFYLVNEINR